MNIVVTGSVAYDYLMSFSGKFTDHILPDKLDKISLSFLVESLKRQHGGNAANIAYSLALLGERPRVLAAVGTDFDPYRTSLETAGVDTRSIRVFEDAYTASFFCNTDMEGNQIASFYAGAMRHAPEMSVLQIDPPKPDLVLVSPNEPDAIVRTVKECREAGIDFVYDPSQQITSMTGEQLQFGLKNARMLILNDYELGMFTKKTGLDEARILESVGVLVVTLGEKGSVIRTPDGKIDIPPAKVSTVVDPTGVGDAYRSGLVKGVLHGLPLDVAGRMGSLAAAYVLETDGPQDHAYTLESFVERYEETFGYEENLQTFM